MRIAISAAALLLTACASLPPSYIGDSWSSPAAGLQVVTVERPSTLFGDAPLTVWVDGQQAAQLPGGQTINLYVPEGRHIIGVGMYGRSGDDAPERSISVDVSASHHPRLKAGVVALGYGGWKVEEIP